MKMGKQAILRRLGMVLAAALLFTALAASAWADNTDGNDPVLTADATGTPSSSVDPSSDSTGKPLDSETALSGGSLTVTGYTVTDAAGNELQRIEAGQKCRIIVSVVDSRIVPDPDPASTSASASSSASGPQLPVTKDEIKSIRINVKVTSTASFASPSLGDITTTTIKPESDITTAGLKYAIILNDITYRGGDNKLALDIAYDEYTYPLPLASVEQAISQCYDAEKMEEPKDSALVLTSASYGGGSVVAGSDFTLTVDVMAPAKYAGAENVKVIITPPEQFTASSGSTMIYVGDLAPGASRQVSFALNAGATAQSGSYAIGVNVTGTAAGAGGAGPSDSMNVTVPVTQPERFEISRTDLPEYLSMGEEGYAYVSFVNKGKGTIYNVSAEITGEGITTTEGNQYIGNVASGTESSADFTIQTSQAGTVSALLTITYEDEKGNIKELTKDFAITVEEMNPGGMDDFMPGEFDPMPMPEENAGMPLWGWILIAVGVLAAGGGAAFLILKKKKAKKKAAQLTEDDDEDI